MSKYNLHFKYRAVLHYHQVHSQQRTAEHFNVSRTRLRRWIAAYRQGGIAALQHPQAAFMKTKRKTRLSPTNPTTKKPGRNRLKSYVT
ncbi:helix-turn-helix domain-containing protein [Neisseria yangbaofengii]|uniref:helix-turn-helix domain-containing protein n=1 Tax=Neisseria yangbaofengii TaxID=2709396 RepID=UPI003BA2587F